MLNLIATLAVGTVISFIVFKLAVALYKKVRSPLLNPLLVTVAVIIALLCVFHIPLDSYESSVQLVSFLLGPATVALAYSVYRQRQILKRVAIGTCSHAVGTTKALEMGELEGAMSGVSIAVSGLLTTAIVIIAGCFM